MWSIKWASLGCVCVCKRLPGWFGALFCPCRIFDTLRQIAPPGSICLKYQWPSTSKWAIYFFREGQNACILVCALFSSVWQCQKTSKPWYPFTNLRMVYLMHILTPGRMQTLCFRFHCPSEKKNRVRKSTPRCPFDRKEAPLLLTLKIQKT